MPVLYNGNFSEPYPSFSIAVLAQSYWSLISRKIWHSLAASCVCAVTKRQFVPVERAWNDRRWLKRSRTTCSGRFSSVWVLFLFVRVIPHNKFIFHHHPSRVCVHISIQFLNHLSNNSNNNKQHVFWSTLFASSQRAKNSKTFVQKHFLQIFTLNACVRLSSLSAPRETKSFVKQSASHSRSIYILY